MLSHIILSLTISGIQKLPQAQSKPAVLAVSQNPTDLDHWIVERQNPENVRKFVEKRKLITKEFRDFTFYYSPKLLGMEDAKREAKLLDAIAEQLSGKSRVLDVSKLSENCQATLHGLLSSCPGDDEFHTITDSPDLKLSCGIQSHLGIHYGKTSATYTLGDEPRLDDWKQVVHAKPNGEQVAKWKDQASKGLRSELRTLSINSNTWSRLRLTLRSNVYRRSENSMKRLTRQ